MKTTKPAKPSGLRITLISETWLPEINGVAITLDNQFRALSQRGHQIEVIRPRQKSDACLDASPLFSQVLVGGMPIPGYQAMQLGLPAGRILNARWTACPPDLVHVATEGPLGWSAVKAASQHGIAVTSDFHTNFHSYANEYGVGLLKDSVVRYLRRLHNNTLATLVPTQELQDELRLLGFNNVVVAGRGVDTELFNASRRSEALRTEWGARPDDLVVLSVGRIAAEKNLPLLMDAFQSIKAAEPRAKLVVVGQGPLLPKLQKKYPDAIYRGLRTGVELAEHYASADVFLFPSVTETFGNVTLEALASGLATVAYDMAAAQCHIRSGINGLLVPVGHRDEFIQAARALARSQASVARLRAAAAASVSELTWDKAIDEFESALMSARDTRLVSCAVPGVS